MRKCNSRLTVVLAAVVLASFLAGCATNWGAVANQVSRQKTIMLSYAKAVKEAHAAGKISEEQLTQARLIYDRYAALHNTAMDALTLAQQAKATPPNYTDMLARMNSLVGEMYNFLKVIGVY